MELTEMTNVQMLTLSSSLVATLFGILILILGWLGNKLYAKLDSVSTSLHSIESDLHERITNIDKRLVAVEARCNYEHDRRIGQ